jgi:hypothetical protein
VAGGHALPGRRRDGLEPAEHRTHVFATDTARRRFALYWRIIYPGSAFIRRMWLQAIKRRAETPA